MASEQELVDRLEAVKAQVERNRAEVAAKIQELKDLIAAGSDLAALSAKVSELEAVSQAADDDV